MTLDISLDLNEVCLAVQRGNDFYFYSYLHGCMFTRQYQTIRCRSTTSMTEMVLLCHLMADLKTEHSTS